MTTSYTTSTGSSTSDLSPAHRRMLFDESGISPEVVTERGVRTVSGGRGELPAVFSWRQKRRGGGVLFTIHRPGGETSWVFRPDEPNPEDPGHKYELPSKHYGGPGNVLDVHPSNRRRIPDTSVPAMFVEGIKKSDATTSAARREGIEILPVAQSGVWNWMSDGEPISDMWEIPVERRRVYICNDSDMLHKPEVLMATGRLAEHLSGRGAEVRIVYLPDQPDGSKTGADDFLAGGGTLEQLLGLARPFDPEDLQREKLNRNEQLRRTLAFLKALEEEIPAKTQRDCSKRAAWRVLVGCAEQRGKLVEGGVEIEGLSSRRGAELAAVSQPTFSKCVADLEAEGYLRRGERETKEHATPYVLRVPGGVATYHKGEPGSAGEQGETHTEGESHRGDNVIPPLPEMRWSAPGRKPRRGVVKGTRMVRQGRSHSEEIPSKRRPGKKRLEIVRYLAANGGAATRDQLLERFGGSKTTWRDFKRQTLADLLGRRRQYKGQPLSVGPPVVELDDSGIHLAENWREALEELRIIGQEPEAADDQQRRHLAQSRAYREYLKGTNPPDEAPTEEEMAEGREERQKRRRVEQLVAQGMARHVAAAEVFGAPDPFADGYIEELRPTGDTDPPPEPLEEHPLDCECVDCSAPMPTYARLTPDGEDLG